nr:reverse transcriptase domain-containing protein [Tanacetum cinerariifolium]
MFHFPTDFVVVDFDADPRVPLILGRSFLKTGRALIDVYKRKLTLRVGKEAITLNLDQTLRYTANYDAMRHRVLCHLGLTFHYFRRRRGSRNRGSFVCISTLSSDTLEILLRAPPSPDYIPGLEHVDDEIIADDQPYAEDASPITQSPEEVGYGITDSWDEIVETLQGAPDSTDTELGGYVREFESRVRQDMDEIYTRLDDEQTERQLLAGRLNMLFRDRRAHAYTRQLMETEARMSREAWARQTVISELLRLEHRRSTETSESRTALQGQITALQGQVTALQAQLEHKAYWALKHCNYDLLTTGDHRKVQLNDLNELRHQAYENSLIDKEKTERIHDSKIKDRIFNVGDRVLLFNSRLKIFSSKLKTRCSGPFTITHVFLYGTVELS